MTTPTFTASQACDAFDTAADEFAANPSKRTRYVLATRADGSECSTTDPEASCFCALGLVANKLGIDTTMTQTVIDMLTDKGFRRFALANIFSINDGDMVGNRVVATMKNFAKENCNVDAG